MELALILAGVTGRLLGSSSQLARRTPTSGSARPAARGGRQHGREWVVHCSASLVEELKHLRKRLGTTGG